MVDDAALRDSLRGVLDAVEDASPVEAVQAATHELGAALGALSVSLLVVDLSGRALVRLTHVEGPQRRTGPPGRDRRNGPVRDDGSRRDAQELAVSVPQDDGPGGRALRTQTVQVLDPGTSGTGGRRGAGWTVLAPITERGDALGLLELVLPAEPSESTVAEIMRTAHLLGFVVVASRRHTDLYEWAQRTTPYSLSAEIQRRLLPLGYTCEAGSFTLSAWLEPSAAVGGDTYDYSLDRDLLHLSMTDAMGHGIGSALTATLCVGGLRNARRRGLSLREQAAAANTALCEHQATGGTEAFSTGLLARLDLTTGILEVVNAGHAAPYLLRDGVTEPVDLPADLPFGLFADTRYRSSTVDLRPGDRLVLVTDGMLERNAADLDLADLIASTGSLHPREATRALCDLVLEATGHALDDDATLLVLDWHGDHGSGRRTFAGATV